MIASQIDTTALRGPAHILGWVSLVPVALGAVMVWVVPEGGLVEASFSGLVIYCTLLVSFAAGARFGLQALPEQAFGRISDVFLALLPPIGAFLALLLAHPGAGAALIAVLMAHVLWDVIGADRGRLPEWYARLRLWLTGATSILLLVALVGMAQRL